MSQTKPKKSLFRRILKWTSIFFLVLIIFIIAAPFIFKDKIVAIVKEEANSNLNAKVDFGDFDLSLLSSFPDFKFKIRNVSVVGINEFKDDTLASFYELSTEINLKSVISGGPYGINSIVIDKARILGKVLADGKANWDIVKKSADSLATANTKNAEPGKFAMKLKQLKIKNAYIVYDDQQANMFSKLDDFNYNLTGDFTQDNFVLSNTLEIAKTTFKKNGVAYLNEVNTKLKADLEMDMPKMKFTFKENQLDLNELGLLFDGFISMPDTNITMDLKFSAKQTEFKSILSLIPAIYSKQFASIQTSGKLALNGFAKGVYNTSSLPAFSLDLSVKDAMFKYPSLPKSVHNINMNLHVSNPTGVLDATVIDVKTFHIELAGNPVDMYAHVTSPVSDPNLKASLKGTINLASVKEYVPIEKGDDFDGTIKSDISVVGRLSAVEKKDFDNFKAEGSIEIDKLNYNTAALPYEILLNNMILKFTNQYVELLSFNANLGKSDLQAKGRIDNFMHYLFKNEALKGSFVINSKLMDLNELMSSVATATTSAPSSTAVSTVTNSGVAEVPGNIDFSLASNVDKVLFQNMVIDHLIGNILVRNSKAEMTNLKMNTLGGSMIMSGFYETANPKKPITGLHLKVDNFDIQNTFKTFNTIQKIAPVAQYAKGEFSATLENFNVVLNSKMEPDLNSVNAHGVFKTNKVVVGGFPPFVKLGDALKMEQLKSMDVSNLTLNYKLVDGRLVIDPFDTKINGINTNISGSTGIDQTIDYKWKLDIPKSMFGGANNSVLTSLLSQANTAAGTQVKLGDKIKVVALFGGTVTKPTVKASLKEDTKSAVATVTNQVLNAGIDKANEEAQKILDDAKAQVEKIKAETTALVDKTKQEGYAAADKLVEEASNPIQKIAAKKAAEFAKKKTDEKAQKIVDDSNDRCQKILDDAKAKSEAKAAESKK